MPTVGLLDTSTLILLAHVADPSSLPDEPTISTITLAELSVGPVVAATDDDRVARLAHLQLAESDFDPIPFDAAAARAFALVSSSLRSAGRKPDARAFDALIASVAISRGIPLYTCNPSDFTGISGLDLRPVAVDL
ncbi:type II toxin-antitoxin system VapC family toxin [Diaminobutyricibacter tongyongensis]|uniref:Type II toxin-antitoxin system VapC family toxin n=1 Tax=Leifsonia tongyongensis TaxID=1268043 RepID=A0A6L9XU45_9MICO|nr:type II toxin-antitoxin system VapC family toxin [Diaminobutyricibacter tongyongensis]NEN04528.1 type II toxin-antitoxin system VapC family toxin [Diaminobutyricibacter tongyongensis]